MEMVVLRVVEAVKEGQDPHPIVPTEDPSVPIILVRHPPVLILSTHSAGRPVRNVLLGISSMTEK